VNEKIKKLIIPVLNTSMLICFPLELMAALVEVSLLKWTVIYVLAAALIGYAFAQWLDRLKRGIAWAILAVVCAVPAPFVLPDDVLLKVFTIVMAVVAAIWTRFSSSIKLRYALSSKKVMGCMVMYAVAYIVIPIDSYAGSGLIYQVKPFVVAMSIFWLAAGSMIVNRITVNKMVSRKEDGKAPAEVMRSNQIMTVIMLAVVFAIVLFDTFRQWIVAALKWLLLMIITLLSKIGVDNPFGGAGEEEIVGNAAATIPIEPGSGTGRVEILFSIVAVALLVLLAWAGVKGIIKLVQLYKDRYSSIISKSLNERDYVEEDEDIFDWDELRGKIKNSLFKRKFKWKLTDLDELPDPRDKVRRIYKWLCLEYKERKIYDPALTPFELIEKNVPEGKKFAETYAAARYSEQDIAAEKVDEGIQLLKKERR